MGTHIALLRGINLGGHNRVAMSDLRQLCVDAGFADVRTYVQSGNVVFTSTRDDPGAISHDLSARLRTDLGVAAAVVVRTVEEFAAVVAGNPFQQPAAADPTTVHAAFLSAEPNDPSSLTFNPDTYVPERLVAGDRVRYLLLPNGIGRSKLAPALLRRAGDIAVTVRNWRTVTELLRIARG